MAKIIISTLFFLCLQPVFAETRIEMQGTSIIGNHELPKILYIVPWKKSELPEMQQPPMNQIISDVLTPIERDEFKRQIYYHRAFSNTEETP
ncbi:MAG: hypothetical protein OQK73_01675 [Gammaproteobacteria bacterium]|nr:hypothetical protein [Gammaproteobacteria bacterium]